MRPGRGESLVAAGPLNTSAAGAGDTPDGPSACAPAPRSADAGRRAPARTGGDGAADHSAAVRALPPDEPPRRRSPLWLHWAKGRSRCGSPSSELPISSKCGTAHRLILIPKHQRAPVDQIGIAGATQPLQTAQPAPGVAGGERLLRLIGDFGAAAVPRHHAAQRRADCNRGVRAAAAVAAGLVRAEQGLRAAPRQGEGTTQPRPAGGATVRAGPRGAATQAGHQERRRGELAGQEPTPYWSESMDLLGDTPWTPHRRLRRDGRRCRSRPTRPGPRPHFEKRFVVKGRTPAATAYLNSSIRQCQIRTPGLCSV